MSDNEDLLGDDLGDQSLADYNLGNEEEEQLLADDYESGPQNVPTSIDDEFIEAEMVPSEYSRHAQEYVPPPMQYQPLMETECVVPNIAAVPNIPHAYTPVQPHHYEVEHTVPPAIPAGPVESPQIVPSEINVPVSNGEGRERFVAERPAGAQRMPQVRDIPDSLDKVVIPRGFARGRTTWRSAHFHARFQHPYRRHHVHRGNFSQRNSFPPPQQVARPKIPPQVIRQEIRPEMIRREIRPAVIRQEMRPQMIRQDIRPEMIRQEIRPEMNRQEMRPEMNRQEMRPEMNRQEMRPEMNRQEMRPEMNRQEMRPEMNRQEMRPEMNRQEMRPEMNRQDNRPDLIRQDIHPEMIRQEIRQEMIRQELRPENIRPELRPDLIRSDAPREMMRPEMHPDILRQAIRPDLPPNLPQMGPEISPERPMLPDMSFRPSLERPQFQQFPRFQFRPEERGFPMRPNFERPMYPFPRHFHPRFAPPMREIIANSGHMPQVTVRQVPDKMPGKEPEVRMLPVPLPPHLPGGLTGKKVLINPHFKGYFQAPVEGLPTYIPTRIQKSPPLSPPSKFGAGAELDAAAERFIAEQRSALARAARAPRREPQRYIENTTIEIENELAQRPALHRSDDDDLLRRQEEFINANRAGLRRRMRSPPPPPRRSPSPRRARPSPPRAHDDARADTTVETDYKRRVREQESLRERVLRAKEVRRRKNAVALHKQMQDKERENQEKNQPKEQENLLTTTKDTEPLDNQEPATTTNPEETKPDTTRKTPERKTTGEGLEIQGKLDKEVKERVRERSPVNAKDDEVNSTCEPLTPPPRSPALTPPWPEDDDLDVILGDIDCILSDDEDSGRFKDKPAKSPPRSKSPPPSRPVADLRSKLPPKAADAHKYTRQKIVFADEKEERRKKEKTPPRRAVVSSTKADDADSAEKKSIKLKPKAEVLANKSRQRITFSNKEKQVEKQKDVQEKTPPFMNRRVILQRKLKDKPDRSQPHPGIFSRAVRTALGDAPHEPRHEAPHEPRVEYGDDDDDVDEHTLLEEGGTVAAVDNLPHGMTDTRLRTLAGADVQNLVLDKEERTAKITFKTTVAADTFKKKFNNKMVAASRLTVTLR